MTRIQAATQALRNGEIVLLYDADGREEETDMVVLSEHATPEMVATMRRDAGGLLCTAIAPEHHEAFGLPFLTDVIQMAADDHPVLRAMLPHDIQYDGSKPAFGITLNHRETFTGVPDEDRSLTIRSLADLVARVDALDEPGVELGRRFRSPGHVILLNGAPGGLGARQGHTELSLELARQAGTTPCTSVCEMLDATTGKALSRSDAEAYADEHGLVFLTGDDVLEAWKASNHTSRPMSVPTSA